MGYYKKEELLEMGFKSIGENVRISDKAVIYGAQYISIGDHSRIDDFCVLSAGENGITIGKFVHIAVYCSLIGKERIQLDDFSGLSSRVALYSSSDDYSGNYLTNPCVPKEYTNVDSRPIYVGKHVIIGVASTVLPGVKIMEGSAIGAYSLVNRDIPEHVIAVGCPAKVSKPRSINIFSLEKELIKKMNDQSIS